MGRFNTGNRSPGRQFLPDLTSSSQTLPRNLRNYD